MVATMTAERQLQDFAHGRPPTTNRPPPVRFVNVSHIFVSPQVYVGNVTSADREVRINRRLVDAEIRGEDHLLRA